MKYQQIDDENRLWVVMWGREPEFAAFDAQLLTSIGEAQSAEEVADLLIVNAGEMDIAEKRLW